MNTSSSGRTLRLIVSMTLAVSASQLQAATSTTVLDGQTIRVNSVFLNYQGAVDRDWTDGHRAYDYAPHLMNVAYGWELHWGGRWKTGPHPFDGDHVLRRPSTTGQPGSFGTVTNPEFFLGQETGQGNAWWGRNTLEPEVVIDGGLWQMLVQCQITAGDILDNGQTATDKADRFVYMSRTGGGSWSRKTDRSAVYNVSDPTFTKLTHQEMMYVPWASNKWWLLFAVQKSGTTRHYTIKGNDPKNFNFATKVQNSGVAQLGNQIGYLENTPLGDVYVRITFFNNGSRTVPTLQFSTNGGITWRYGSNRLEIAGSNNNVDNKNCYFLGFATNNGKGKFQKANGNFRARYVPCTSNGPAVPDIYRAEIGLGDMTIIFE